VPVCRPERLMVQVEVDGQSVILLRYACRAIS
jgi:hypothetical protein